jgi:hypothetical protein
MKTIARSIQSTKASPTAIFQLWQDVNNWNIFDESVEWAHMTGEFKRGGVFRLKPKGGPKVNATIVSVENNREFTNTSKMPGAQLKFSHVVAQEDGVTAVSVVISITGPLEWFWAKILSRNQPMELEKSVTNLIHLAEKGSLNSDEG